MAVVAALLVLLLATPAARAVQYTVGDTSGWTTNYDYTTWVQGKTFTTGDVLLFSYGGLHSVDVVSQSDYQNCNSGNALKSYSGGNTLITLSNVGSMYFICPTSGHCSEGMKLGVNVVAANGSSPTTPSPPSGSTTPSGSSPSPTTHSGNGASTITKNSLMLGFSLVLGAVLAIMS